MKRYIALLISVLLIILQAVPVYAAPVAQGARTGISVSETAGSEAFDPEDRSGRDAGNGPEDAAAGEDGNTADDSSGTGTPEENVSTEDGSGTETGGNGTEEGPGTDAETGAEDETDAAERPDTEDPAEEAVNTRDDSECSGEADAETAPVSEGAGGSLRKEEGTGTLLEEQAYVTLEDGYYSLRPFSDSTLALYIPGASEAENKETVIFKANTSYAQKFMFIPVKGQDGTYMIRIFSSGKYLGLKDAKAVNSAAVVQKSSTSGNDEKWRLKANSDGSYTVCSAMNEKMVLDIKSGKIISGTAVQIYTSNNSTAQKWTLRKLKDPTAGTPADGMYKIMSGVGGFKNYALNAEKESKADKSNISIYSSSDSNFEKFNITSVGYGNLYKIINVGSGKSLDVAGGGTADKTNVRQYSYNGSKAQLFRFLPNDDGSYSIRDAGSGKVLDVNGAKAADNTNVAIYTSNGSKAQKWKLAATKKSGPAKSPVLKTGIYSISTAVDPAFVIEVKGGSTANGANIALYKSNGTNAQKFFVKSLGHDNYYTVECVKSGKMMEVQGAKTADGSNVRQNAANGADSQVWQILPLTGGQYEIVGAASKKALDVSSGIASNGRNIQIYSRNKSAAQKWSFKSASYVPESAASDPKTSAAAVKSCMEIRPASDESLLIRTEGNKITRRSVIQTTASNGSSASRFILISKGGGQYEIVHAASGMALEVKGGKTAEGTALQIYDRNDTAAQRWKLVPSGQADGSFYIESVPAGGKVITVKGGAVKSGLPLQISTKNGSAAQRFCIRQSKPRLDGIVKLLDRYALYSASGALLKDDFKAAHNYPQLITVGVTNVNYASVSMYTRRTDGSFTRNYTAPGRIGTNGLGKSVEGDRKTPKGIYTLHTPFGIKDDPGCPVKYTKVTKYHYWGGSTPTESYYNRLADASKIKNYTPGGEHLIDYTGSYNYAVAIGWNPSNTRGKGAAIFLHCAHGNSTGGCVAIPESNMKTTLQKLNANARIIIDTPGNVAGY